MTVWHLITPFGDAGLMVPAALVIAVWLSMFETRSAALIWLTLFSAAGLLVSATKIAFLGWGIGSHRFNFTGISGHSMMSMAVLPMALLLIAGDTPRNRQIFVPLGMLAAVLVAMSRVKIHAHTPSEAVTGALLGATAVGLFLILSRAPAERIRNVPLLSVSLVLVLILGYGRPVPSEDLVTRAALLLSGRDHPYTRAEWWRNQRPDPAPTPASARSL